MFLDRLPLGRILDGGEVSKRWGKFASVDQGGVGGIGEMALVTETTAAKDAMEIQRLKLLAKFAWRWVPGRGYRRKGSRVVVDFGEGAERQRLGTVFG